MKNCGIRKAVTVNFRVVNTGTVRDVFETLKQYQALSLADEDSSIIDGNVVIPAGAYEDINEILDYHQEDSQIRKRKLYPEERKIASIDFCVEPGESLESAFIAMQQYQDYGFADSDSRIIYKGISIPAGYCENSRQVSNIYENICAGSVIGIMKSLPNSLGVYQMCNVLMDCAKESEKIGVSMTIDGTSENDTNNKVMTKK